MSTTPRHPQNPDHPNGTCEACGQPCAVCGPRWCPECYYVNGVPRDLMHGYDPDNEHPGADYTLAGPLDECEGLDGQPIDWQPSELDAGRYP
jgi:hypothetical protein